MVNCVMCGARMKQLTNSQRFDDAYTPCIVRNFLLVCRKCGFNWNIFDIDPYNFHHLLAQGLAKKTQVLFTAREVKGLTRFLGVHACCDQDFARYINFNNFDFLVQHKIDAAQRLYRNDEQDPDDKELMASTDPFIAEAANLVAQKLGFKHYGDLHHQLGEPHRPMTPAIDQMARMLLAILADFEYPAVSVKRIKGKYLVEVCY